MEQLSFVLRPQDRLYSVTDLTLDLKDLLNREYRDVRVAGEISGLKAAASGHAYFTLKDDSAQIRCTLYRSTLRYMKFKPQDGVAVVARGYIDVWEARGDYQLIVNSLDPQGYGALQVAFEQLKKQLEAEGLFAPGRKRPLPPYPARIGIVTSPDGAAIRDMINILGRRFPGIRVRLFPTAVQGEGAAAGICEGLRYFSRTKWAQVVIAGRGGGSLEDLWAFNEESVARAIAESAIPVVSAVGHETDFTISDFVADLRAPTPSAAAELVAPSATELSSRITHQRDAAVRALRYALSQSGRRLQQNGVDRAAALLHRRIGRILQSLDESGYHLRAAVSRTLDRGRDRERALERRLIQQDVRLGLLRAKERLESMDRKMSARIRHVLAQWRRRTDPLDARIGALSPLQVLSRGYSIVQNEQGRVVTSPDAAALGSRIHIRLARGQIAAIVSEQDSSGPEGGRQ